MDIGCGMEFQFSVGNNLSEFGDGPTEIHDKLDLGTGQLLDSVSVPASCTDHDASEKHLSAADFKLDLGPANDLVSCADFHLETSVSDISSESTIPEECSEGYSIVNSALEGGSVPKHTMPVSCALNLGNVSNVQTVQLNQVNLSQLQSMQVIPIQNMQMLSNVRPVQSVNKVQSMTPEGLKVSVPGVVNPGPSTAVLLGNVLLLQTLQRQICVPNSSNRVVPSNSGISQTQVFQILNTTTESNFTKSPPSQQIHQTMKTPNISTTYSPEATVSSILKSRSQELTLSNPNFQVQNRVPVTEAREIENIPCGNVMSLNPPAVAQHLQSSGGLDLHTQQSPGNTDTNSHIDMKSQKNTKILVYGKNIALTFDCRNQKYVMNTLTKAVNSSVSGNAQSVKTQNSAVDCTPGSTGITQKTIGNVLQSGAALMERNTVPIQQPVKYISLLKPTMNNLPAPTVDAAQNANNLPSTVLSPGTCDHDSLIQKASVMPSTAIIQNQTITKGLAVPSVRVRNGNTCVSSETSVINVNINLQKDKLCLNASCASPPHLSPTRSSSNPVVAEKVRSTTKGQKVQNFMQNYTSHQHSSNKRVKIADTETQNKGDNNVDEGEWDDSLSEDSGDETEKVLEYRYKCELCSAMFNRQGNYNRHRLIHTVGGKDGRRYQCPECGRQFLQRCDMKRHMLIHSKQEPFRCNECGKGYIRKSDLVVHMRFHKKEKAFRCHLCSKDFYQSGDLNRHIRTLHFSSTLVKCAHCKKQFAKEATLNRHMQMAHKCIIDNTLRQKDRTENGNNSRPTEISEGDNTSRPEQVVKNDPRDNM